MGRAIHHSARPLAMLTGRAPELFSDPLGLRPVTDTNVVLADARTPPSATP